jgi:hypothetical protein
MLGNQNENTIATLYTAARSFSDVKCSPQIRTIYIPAVFEPSKDGAQTASFNDPVRTAL